MKYGYSRISTNPEHSKQEHTRQIKILNDFNVDEIFYDSVSGSSEALKRQGFTEMYNKLQEGDTIYFDEMSRLSRSMQGISSMTIKLVEEKRVTVHFIKENIIMSKVIDNPMAQFQFNVIASMYELERGLIRQRVKEGLEATKAKGTKLGRPKDNSTRHRVYEMLSNGCPTDEIMERLNISRSLVTRYRKEYKEIEVMS